MEKEKRKNEIIKYKVFALRLNEETKKMLIKEQKKSGLSWNLFMVELLKELKKKNGFFLVSRQSKFTNLTPKG